MGSVPGGLPFCLLNLFYSCSHQLRPPGDSCQLSFVGRWGGLCWGQKYHGGPFLRSAMCLCYCNPSADLAKVRGRHAPPPFSAGGAMAPPFAPAGASVPPSAGRGICPPTPSSPVVDFYPSSTVISLSSFVAGKSFPLICSSRGSILSLS